MAKSQWKWTILLEPNFLLFRLQFRPRRSVRRLLLSQPTPHTTGAGLDFGLFVSNSGHGLSNFVGTILLEQRIDRRHAANVALPRFINEHLSDW